MARPASHHTSHFDAFISYSREDIVFARQLEKTLESYKPPKDIQAPHRYLQIFRDEGDFTGVEYFQSVVQYLKNSAKLIVLCSPAARQSEYVNDEIRRFAKLQGKENIIPLLLGGIPNNEAGPDQEDQKAFPEALLEAYQSTEMPLATPYLNFNPRVDKINKGAFSNSWYTLIANIFGSSRSDIEQRDQKARIRRLYTALVAGGFAMLLLVGLTIVAFWQRNIAIHQSKISLSRQLAVMVSKLSAIDLCLLLAAQAVKLELTLEARESMLAVLEKHYNLAAFLPGKKEIAMCMAFSPDGLTLATGNLSNTICLWDVAKRQLRGEPLTGHLTSVVSLAFSPDGRTLASGSKDGTIILWSLDSKQSLATLLSGHKTPTPSSINCLVFTPDGRILASGGDDEKIILWDVEKREASAQLFMSDMGGVASAAFNYNGQILASGNRNGRIILWDVKKRQPVGKYLSGHYNFVDSLVFSQDARILISHSYDHQIILWDVAKQQPIDIEKYTYSRSQTLSPDGKKLVYSEGDDLIVFDREKQRKIKIWYGPTDKIVSFSFSPDGRMLVSRDSYGDIILWDLVERQLLMRHVGPEPKVALSPDGRLVAFGNSDGSIILKEANSQQVLLPPLVGHKYDITEVVFSPDAKTLASGDSNGNVILWNIQQQEIINKFILGQGGDGGRYGIEISQYGTFEIVKEGEPGVNKLAFSPNGKILAADLHNTIILWEVERKTVIGELIDLSSGISAIAFSPEGNKLASGGHDGHIILWDVEKKQPIGEPLLGHQGRITSLAFSPQGNILASSDNVGKSVILWDIEKKQIIINFLNTRNIDALHYKNEVIDLAFTPDGRTLAIGNIDMYVELVDMEHLSHFATFTTGGFINFSPDGKTLISANPNQTVILWDVDVQSWIRRACRKANRNLTKEEWRHYLGDLPYRKICPDLPGPEEEKKTFWQIDFTQ